MRTQSNSKITTEQKAWVKSVSSVGGWATAMKFFHHVGEGVTVAMLPDGKGWVTVAMAFCAKDEKFYSPKVGEYHALQRHDNGHFLRVPCNENIMTLEYMALGMVDSLCLDVIPRQFKEKKPKVTKVLKAEHADYKNYHVYKNLRARVKRVDSTRWPDIKAALKVAFLCDNLHAVEKDCCDTFDDVFSWGSSPQGIDYWLGVSNDFDHR
jgi:hypothetical protein